MSLTLSLGSSVSIFAIEDVTRALEKADSPGSEGLRRVYQKMLAAGPQRFVTKPTSANVLTEVQERCPNFAGVLEDLANYIELSVVNKKGLSILPILLAGDPGVGKTHFAKTLARALSVPFHFTSMGTMTAGFVLGGSAPTWSGARHGKVAEALIDSEFANPLYLLDELDKTGGSERYDPYGSLLQLLEPETAQHFKDEFLDVEMDTSAILWVATANDISRIPDHILSRMAIYDVPAPTEEQAKTIAGNIYTALCIEHDWPFEPSLREETQGALRSVPPRELRKKLLDGLASAIRSRRNWLAPEDIRSSHVKATRSIGFTRP